jgi:hypothetical protein
MEASSQDEFFQLMEGESDLDYAERPVLVIKNDRLVSTNIRFRGNKYAITVKAT